MISLFTTLNGPAVCCISERRHFKLKSSISINMRLQYRKKATAARYKRPFMQSRATSTSCNCLLQKKQCHLHHWRVRGVAMAMAMVVVVWMNKMDKRTNDQKLNQSHTKQETSCHHHQQEGQLSERQYNKNEQNQKTQSKANWCFDVMPNILPATQKELFF